MSLSWRPKPKHRASSASHPDWSVWAFFLDILLLVGVALCGLIVYQSVRTQPEYHWDWHLLADYLILTEPRVHPGLLLQGLFTTLRLTLGSGVVATLIGIIAGTARTSSSRYLRLVSGTYVELCRNLPPLVLVFICHFFLANQFASILNIQDLLRSAPSWIQSGSTIFFGDIEQVEAFVTAIVTLGIYEGAYIAEIVRGGILAVPTGQWEAGAALGFPKTKLLMNIVYPQAIRMMLPPLASQMISTIKDSAIVSVISIQELTFQGAQLVATTYRTFEVWIAVAGLYFLVTYASSLLASRLEKKLQQRSL